ncbi:AraC family transcriptional regulator [Terribacillus saccharophilus]|uniref:DNA gyrase inhibitor n=1 Tax=Terribacillus saccharophilus TaxID=361277 RepID=A0ABX4GXT0_9BACI|nr:GyrI-like domain-containing protein [Terribacillus saccharophilus]PAD35264.1 DNA gyrase inhibitor [Terribacillus saccharophilus]PAD96013.1 DNA gyrase inhibitor [Terribacillus saccharophilus]PAD99663.1 DNA gyrase inhibitor [Terribacillus saccharophilus]
MKVKIETIPTYQIAYFRRVGPYGAANYQTMQELKEWAAAKKLLDDTSIILGISQDNVETTDPQKCRYDAALVVPEGFQKDDMVLIGELKGGKYINFTVQHTIEAMTQAWTDIFYELANNGYEIDNRPTFERFTAEMLSEHFCEICIPIK